MYGSGRAMLAIEHLSSEPELAFSECFQGRQWRAQNALPEVLQPATGEVLHDPRVQVVEQGVDGEVAAFSILR